MHRARLILALALAAGCKKAPPEAASQGAALAALPDPEDRVWAASGVVRVVDARARRVEAGIPVGRPISHIAFSPEGASAFVGTSEGLFLVDAEAGTVLRRLTDHPVRRVEVSGGRVWILEHQVLVAPDGAREVLPFRRVSLALPGLERASDEEIGQRIHFVSAGGPRHTLIVAESGELRLARAGAPLYEARTLDLLSALAPSGPFRVRGDASVARDGRAFVPVEGTPSALLEVGLDSGELRVHALGRPLQLRGLGLLADGRLLVNALFEVMLFDPARGTATEGVPLPGAHMGAAIGPRGDFAYLAQTVDGTGGAVTTLRLDPLAVAHKVHLDDISPWAIAVRPR